VVKADAVPLVFFEDEHDWITAGITETAPSANPLWRDDFINDLLDGI
jgi:hypothetical protein